MTENMVMSYYSQDGTGEVVILLGRTTIYGDELLLTRRHRRGGGSTGEDYYIQ